MEYLKKIIEKDLKNMTESEREIYRKAALLTFQNLTEELINRSESFEEKIWIGYTKLDKKEVV